MPQTVSQSLDKKKTDLCVGTPILPSQLFCVEENHNLYHEEDGILMESQSWAENSQLVP